MLTKRAADAIGSSKHSHCWHRPKNKSTMKNGVDDRFFVCVLRRIDRICRVTGSCFLSNVPQDGTSRACSGSHWLFLLGNETHSLRGIEDSTFLLTILFPRSREERQSGAGSPESGNPVYPHLP